MVSDMFAFPQPSDDPAAQVERYFGKYPGIVTSTDPPEQGDHLGEIRVRIPAILEDTPDGEGQQPIEVLALPCFAPGMFFVPEVDDHVWVEFAGGDINQPIWTGVWYPRDAPPKNTLGAPPTREHKVLRSAGGHVIELHDSADDGAQAFLRIQKESGSEPDCVITITDKGFVIETASSSDKSIVLRVGADASLTLDQNGIELVGKESKLKLAQGEVLLETGGTSARFDGTKIGLKASQVAVE
jgi:hypothetical protein